jgi:hypothetical protein
VEEPHQRRSVTPILLSNPRCIPLFRRIVRSKAQATDGKAPTPKAEDILSEFEPVSRVNRPRMKLNSARARIVRNEQKVYGSGRETCIDGVIRPARRPVPPCRLLAKPGNETTDQAIAGNCFNHDDGGITPDCDPWQDNPAG